MRWLKAVVIIMGILIIVGIIILIIGIGQKFSNSRTSKQLDWSSIPPSSYMTDWIAMDDKIILIIQKPDTKILFYTLHSNQLKPGQLLELPFPYQSKDNQ